MLARRNARRIGVFNIVIGVCLWIMSAGIVSFVMLRGLESAYRIPQNPEGDVIVLLGGGIVDGVPDISGSGRPSDNMSTRIVAAVRLQKSLGVPIIVSGGRVHRGSQIEARIYARFLEDLGIGQDYIIIEDRSRDTYENAKYTKIICENRGFEIPIVLTNAYHLKRAVLSFKKNSMEVTPYPASFGAVGVKKFFWGDYLPSAVGFMRFSEALHEYVGLIYYSIFY
ncbi:MAG: YdcF family protein [Elusimicrobia bacterium]|nr:YdcF family protein [Elusimicrobiota bacterium]